MFIIGRSPMKYYTGTTWSDRLEDAIIYQDRESAREDQRSLSSSGPWCYCSDYSIELNFYHQRRLGDNAVR